MAVLDPYHLLEQAEKLIGASHVRRHRQVDLRRAVSTAYYAVFHFLLTAAADMYVGKTRRASPIYALLYRSIGHRELRDICIEVKKQQPSARYQRYAPRAGFGSHLQAFASACVELQEKRHASDYDPSFVVAISEAIRAVETARTAIRRFQKASLAKRKAYLALLLFSPR